MGTFGAGKGGRRGGFFSASFFSFSKSKSGENQVITGAEKGKKDLEIFLVLL